MSFVSLVVLAASPSPSPSLSQSTPTSPLPGENDPTWLGPGLLGFLSLVFLAVAVFVIYLSLNKQLGRVTFDEDAVNGELPHPPIGVEAVAGPDQSDSEATGTPSAQPSD